MRQWWIDHGHDPHNITGHGPWLMVKLRSWRHYLPLHTLYHLGVPPTWRPTTRLSDYKTVAPARSLPPPPPPPPPEPAKEICDKVEVPNKGDRLPEPKTDPIASAPDGVAEAGHDVPDVFADVKMPYDEFCADRVDHNRSSVDSAISYKRMFGP